MAAGTANIDVVESSILDGYEGWNADGALITGTIPSRGTWDLRLSFPGAGYYLSVSNPPAASSIVNGLKILGVTGTAIKLQSSAGTTSTSSKVLSGSYFWNDMGIHTAGTMINHGAFDLTGSLASSGYISSFTGLTTAQVCDSTRLLGANGSAKCPYSYATVHALYSAIIAGDISNGDYWVISRTSGKNLLGTVVNSEPVPHPFSQDRVESRYIGQGIYGWTTHLTETGASISTNGDGDIIFTIDGSSGDKNVLTAIKLNRPLMKRIKLIEVELVSSNTVGTSNGVDGWENFVTIENGTTQLYGVTCPYWYSYRCYVARDDWSVVLTDLAADSDYEADSQNFLFGLYFYGYESLGTPKLNFSINWGAKTAAATGLTNSTAATDWNTSSDTPAQNKFITIGGNAKNSGTLTSKLKTIKIIFDNR